MAKCKNCGAEVTSKFCMYCGTKNDSIKEDKINLDEGSVSLKDTSHNSDPTSFTGMIGNLFTFLNKSNELVKASEKMKGEGREYFNDDEMLLVKDMFSQTYEISKHNDETSLAIKEERQKMRNARRAIASGHCPECGANIKKSTEYCPKCGADCLIETYSDL